MRELMDYLNEDAFTGICDIRDRIEELLEKEKEQIIKAHIDGFDHIVVDFKKQEYAEQYYNQTYNQ